MNWLAAQESRLTAFLRKEFAPSTERWHATIRVLFATTLAMLVIQIFHLNQGYWCIVTIMIVCAPSVDSSVHKMIQRVFGTLAGVAFAYIITAVFYQQYWFYLASFFAAITLAGLVIARSERPYVGWVFALSILIVALESPTGFDQIAQVSFERFWIVALGVIASWIALTLIYPVRPIRDFRSKYIVAVDAELQRTQWIIDRLRNIDRPRTALPPKSLDPAVAQKMFVLLGDAAFTDQSARHHLASLIDRVTLIGAVGSITSNTIALSKQLDGTSVNAALIEPTIRLMESLASILTQLRIWAATSKQRDAEFIASLETAPVDFESLRAAIEAFARAHEAEILRLGIREGTGLSPLVSQGFMSTISLCRAFHATYSTALGERTEDAHVNRADVLRMISTPLLAPGLKDDATRSFWFSIKLATACLIGLLFVATTHFPSLGTMMVTPLMVVAATGGSSEGTRARAKLRLVGTLVGWAMSIFAILFLIPTVDSSPGLLLVWIGCSAPLIWIMTGGPHISYAGVQAVFCLAIGLGTTFQPTIDLAAPSGRIIGVMLGTLVTLAIFNWFRPDFARNELTRIFALTLERASKVATLGFPSNSGTQGDLTQLRYKMLSLILRSRNLSQSLQSEPRASEPAITNERIEEIADHLTLIVYTNTALALNRVMAKLDPETLFIDLAELQDCANSIATTCLVGSNALESGNYAPFATATRQLDTQSQALEQLVPAIRARPRIRVMSAESSEFVLGQIGMYRVAASRLLELSNVLDRIAADRPAKAFPRRDSPVHCAPSSIA